MGTDETRIMIIREVVPHALPQPSYPCFIGVHPWLKILRIPHPSGVTDDSLAESKKFGHVDSAIPL
jgi:hypothetical protein